MIRNDYYCLIVFGGRGGGCYHNNPQPEVYKKNLKIDLKVMMINAVYTLTFHRLLRSILNVCSPRKTKTIQKKGIWSFLRYFTLIFYLSKLTRTIFPRVIFDVKFPALFKSQSKIGEN